MKLAPYRRTVAVARGQGLASQGLGSHETEGTGRERAMSTESTEVFGGQRPHWSAVLSPTPALA